MENDKALKKIAVVGGGIAGIVAAYLLSRQHQVTLFEKNKYLGGHTNTIMAQDADGTEVAVDTGFIVCNRVNYPNFYKFISELKVPLRDTEMSFSHYCEQEKLGYRGPALSDILTVPANLLKPAFLAMLYDQRRFNRRALLDLERGNLANVTLGQYVQELKLSDYFVRHYLIPLTAAIWSSPDCGVLDFPAETFLTFFRNHGMLDFSKRPTWQTIIGGSHQYIKAFKSVFNGQIKLDAGIVGIKREAHDGTISLRTKGDKYVFDAVVLASHADESLRLLEDPSVEEKSLLGAWNYQTNHTVLHTDSTLLPPSKKLWAAWNYTRKSVSATASPVGITYFMNRLQGLNTALNFCVTLNRTAEIKSDKIIYQTTYTHPQYTNRSVATQKQIQLLNGQRNTYFCGSYLGYGFHEDAVNSSLKVASAFGVAL